METEKYQALVTAIDTGSLAAAADKLGYTTSGISRMMASLENELGLTLLNRSKTGVRPSSACEKILPNIRSLLASADALKVQAANLHGVVTGHVRIGTAYPYYYGALSQAVEQFAESYPNVSVSITSGYSSDLAHKLNAHALDLCIISRRETAGQWLPLCKDEMIAAISAHNPISVKKAFPLSGFAVQPYIETHPDVDNDNARILAGHGIMPNTRYETEDSMATFSMVAANLGVALNNHLNAKLYHGDGIVMLPLRPKQFIDIGIAISDEADDAAAAFADAFLAAVS